MTKVARDPRCWAPVSTVRSHLTPSGGCCSDNSSCSFISTGTLSASFPSLWLNTWRGGRKIYPGSPCHRLLGSLPSLIWVSNIVRHHGEDCMAEKICTRNGRWLERRERRKRGRERRSERERSQYTVEAMNSSNGLVEDIRIPPLNFPSPPKSTICRQTSLQLMRLEALLKSTDYVEMSAGTTAAKDSMKKTQKEWN